MSILHLEPFAKSSPIPVSMDLASIAGEVSMDNICVRIKFYKFKFNYQ